MKLNNKKKREMGFTNYISVLPLPTILILVITTSLFIITCIGIYIHYHYDKMKYNTGRLSQSLTHIFGRITPNTDVVQD